jgi:hypothetical protein
MQRAEKALTELQELIENSSDAICAPEVKQKLTEKVRDTKETLRTPLATDKWIYRFVVCFLGLAVLVSVIFTFFLTFYAPSPQDLKIPDIFLAIGSAAVGALAGLLAPSPGRGSNV